MSFNVDSIEALAQLRASVQEKGIECIDSGDSAHPHSFEFAGPDGMLLQVCCKQSFDTTESFDLDAARAVGLDEEKLEQFKSPRAFERPPAPVPNAAMGGDAGYHMKMPGGTYASMITLPDQLVFDATKEATPPTEKQSFDLKQAVAKAKMTILLIAGMIFKKRSKA